MPGNGTSSESRSGKTGGRIEDTFRDFWANRPVRPVAGRKLAGVAAAIGNRYAIDPTLVRVALVTLALFGGSGLVCYLLGWLLLAQQGDRHSAFGSMVGRAGCSAAPGFGVLLCIGLVIATGAMLSGNFLFGSTLAGPVGFAALLVALYLLQTSRSDRQIQPRPHSPQPSPAPGGDAQQEWDPLGAAPFTWELPEPEPQPPAPAPRAPRRKSKVGLVGVAAVLLALAACVLLIPVSGGWLTVPHILGVLLGVVGLAMVGGAFRGGGRSLILVAVLLACAGLVTVRGDGGFGEGGTTAAPTAPAAVHRHYRAHWGALQLDLTRLPAKGSVRTSVDTRFGRAVVIVPRDAEVTVGCAAEFGEADCLGERSTGWHGDPVRKHLAPPHGKGGLHIQLKASSRFGSLEVRRG